MDLFGPEGLHGLALLAGHPGLVGPELREHLQPLVFRDAFRLREIDVQHEGLDGGELRLPGRVDGVERQDGLLRRPRQRVGRNLLGLRREVLVADGADPVGRHVHGARHGVVEADQLAAHEVVGHLVLDRLAGGQGRGGVLPVRENILLVSLGGVLPGGVVREGRVEGLDVLGRDAGLAAAVSRRTDLLRDGGDERLQRLVVRGDGRDDAVAVEFRSLEDGHAVGCLLHADLVLLQAEVLQDVLRGSEERLPGFAVRIDPVELQHALPFQDGVLVLHHGGQPLRGGDDFLHVHAPVAVGIDQLQGLLVEFQILRRAAQDRPEFLVQLAQVGDVLARRDVHPDHSAQRAEFPGIAVRLFLCHIVGLVLVIQYPQI